VTEDRFGLVELVFVFGAVIGVCLWQLSAVDKARKRLASETERRDDPPPP
jgi:hypothetical protein